MDIKSLSLLSNNPPIILLTTHTWDGLQYFAHHLSRYLVSNGFNVVFVEKSPQRWPNNFFQDFLTWLRKGKHEKSIGLNQENPPKILTPRWLPPSKYLRIINRFIIKNDVGKIHKLLNNPKQPIVIYFPPTYNTLDFLNEISPIASAYINNFNYDADNVMKDLLQSEVELLSHSQAIFGLNNFCVKRLHNLNASSEINLCPPGVDFKLFNTAYRGNEIENCRSVYYFGGIGPHLDLDIFNEIADEGFSITMDGEVDPSIQHMLNSKFKIRPPTPHKNLPELLKDADCLIIAYKKTEYMKGVFPAKFFECLATGKPLIVSGLPELASFSDVVYDVDGSGSKAVEVIRSFSKTETNERITKRINIAKCADWPNRFYEFFETFDKQYQKK